MKTVVLGIASGIAAYKALDLVKELRKEDINVYCIMTANAAKMVPAADFEQASGHPVSIELFERGFDYNKILQARHVDHITLADKADVLMIAPATANIIAKLAHGFADDFLTTTALATTAPLIICPSMNVHMWNNPLVQENITKLRKQGVTIVAPESGMLACGYEGPGRLANIQTIKNEVLALLTYTKTLQGKKILVTAGGTSEKIDDVRSITNRSSGKMAIAIAEECHLRGAEVLLLRAKNSVTPRYCIQEELFTSTEDLRSLIKKHIATYDSIFHAAAVSDFTAEKPLQGKVSSKLPLTLQLKPNKKILEELKQWNPEIRVIAFKAEYLSDKKQLLQAAAHRLKESNADAIIANDISRTDTGFEVDTNEVDIILANGKTKHLPLASKRDIAKSIVEYIYSSDTRL